MFVAKLQPIGKNMASLLTITATFVAPYIFPKKHNSQQRFQDETEPYIRHKTIHESVLEGKDLLIVGDVHGCCDEIFMIQDEARKRTKKEIVTVFVGDLINKGPKSIEVLDYVSHSTLCFSVRGNHDQKIVSMYLKHIKGMLSEDECKDWVKLITPRQADFLKSLPYTLSIPCLNIIIVHAGLLPGKTLKDQNPESMLNMRSIVYEKDDFHGTVFRPTSTKVPGYTWGRLWQGPEHVYFGHDAIKGLQLNKYCTGLDTGCVYGGKLTGALLHLPDIPSQGDIENIHREIISIKPKKTYKDVGYKATK